MEGLVIVFTFCPKSSTVYQYAVCAHGKIFFMPCAHTE